MEINHEKNILEAFTSSQNNIINHMKGFNELYIFLNDSLENISDIMVNIYILNK